MPDIKHILNLPNRDQSTIVYQVPFSRVNLIETKGMPERGPYVVDGVASTGKSDQDGERIIQSGIDYTMFKQHGMLNWNHSTTYDASPTDYIGRVKNVYYNAAGDLCVRAVLFDDSAGGSKVLDLFRKVGRTTEDPYLGYSIEMTALQRDPINNKIIRNCTLVGLAITVIPCNPTVRVRIVTPTKAELRTYAPSKSCILQPYWDGKAQKKSITLNQINTMSTTDKTQQGTSLLNSIIGSTTTNKNSDVNGTPFESGMSAPPETSNASGNPPLPGVISETGLPDLTTGQGVEKSTDSTESAKNTNISQEQYKALMDSIQELKAAGKKKPKDDKEDPKAKPGSGKDPMNGKGDKTSENAESEKSSDAATPQTSEVQDYKDAATSDTPDPNAMKALAEAEALKQQSMEETLNQQYDDYEVGVHPVNDATRGTMFHPERIKRMGENPIFNFNDGGVTAKQLSDVVIRALKGDPNGHVYRVTKDFVDGIGNYMDVFSLPLDEHIGISPEVGKQIENFVSRLTNRRILISKSCLTTEVVKQNRNQFTGAVEDPLFV